MSTNTTYPDSYHVSNGLEPDPVNRYGLARTPSPTPSEVRALTTHIIDYKKYGNWRYWAKKEWIKYYIIGGIILVLTILISVYDKQIVRWLTPAGNWMRKLKFGWLIPIAILFVISFPPLFGHEVVALLVGVIWGLGIGFAIVCAGTFIGELGNFFVFKYLCRARAEKAEKSSIFYGCLAQIVRDGGFKMALLIRLSVIPGHFSTAVFSTCGMSVWIFSLAAFLSLPKQFITVYIGVILEESGTGTETPRDKIISDSVLAVTVLITIGAMWYIVKELERTKPIVVYNRRKLRQAKLAGDPATMLFNQGSESDLVAPRPKRLSTQLSNMLSSRNQEPRRGSGANMGYGGYTPTFIQGRYGEPSDEVYDRLGVRKSMDDVDWETRTPKTAAINLKAKDLEAGKRDDKDLELAASGSQMSLLPQDQGDSPPRQWTPERYATSPTQIGEPTQFLSSQPHLYPPGLNTSVASAPNNTVYQPQTYPAAPPNHYPNQDRPVFQLSDPPVSRPQLSPHTQKPSDDSTLLPYTHYQTQPSVSSSDVPFTNPHDPPLYPHSLYPPSHGLYPGAASDQGQGGHEIQPSGSTISNISSDQSYSEDAALTTPNPHSSSYYPS